jgi:hypothetical protein
MVSVREASPQHGDVLLAFTDLNLEPSEARHVHPAL